MTIKDHVKDNQLVHFEYYHDGNLWYKTDTGYLFPVPIDDIGAATFLKEDRAILFMRYIRKHMEAKPEEFKYKKDSGLCKCYSLGDRCDECDPGWI